MLSETKHLAIFGASGRTGQHLVAQALQRGYEVTALGRSAQKLAAYEGRIEIVEGDVKHAEAVARAVARADAVISVLGPTANRPDYAVTRGTENILEAMKEHGVRRLVVSAGAGVADPNDEPKLLNKLISVLLKLFSRHVYEDMKRMVETVRRSDVDWTIVRVPMLTGEATEVMTTKGVRVGYVGKGMGARLSRANLAGFMLDQLRDETYLHKAPAISD